MIRRKKTLGFGFADEVVKVNLKKGHFKKNKTGEWADSLIPNFDASAQHIFAKSTWRITLFMIACVVLFFIIFLRIFHLQVVSGKTNRELADGNRIQVKVIHAPRGVIFDRNSQVLAANSPAFRYFDPDIQRNRLISRSDALEWEVKNDPRSKDLEVDNVRTYPLGEKFAHVLGYVGEISQEQLKQEKYKNYKAGDRVGQSGIEAEYEKVLRGTDGGEIIEVDSAGRKLRTLRRNTPVPGQNIYLTIDAALQEESYDLLKDAIQKGKGCCGAMVALDPKNGQVLALISLPSYDPNIFTKNVSERDINDIFSSENFPILNRVIAGTYPPGSTFKIISSLAALDSGKVTKDTIIWDNGVINLGTFKFSNWYFTQYGRTEGPVNLIKALERSNDTYFYEIGRMIGEEALMDWSRKLRLGTKLNIDLPGEEVGLVPSNDWKIKNFNQPWYPGDTLHLAIGQGFLLTTPLQVLGVTSYMAADGVLYKPYIVDRTESSGRKALEFKPQVLVSDLISQDKIEIIQKGLEAVPRTGGTAWPFFTFPVKTAGKTGTAEFGDPKDRTHAWYTAYAPVDDPRIALTVLLEAGGEGSTNAAPVVKEILRWFLSENKNKLIQDVYSTASESARVLGE